MATKVLRLTLIKSGMSEKGRKKKSTLAYQKGGE